ncbi:MAG: GNAT family N-acetyltransferase [Flavobacteriaceae bacterium]|nr:GNAT family N-acetyltransferase [Flavobacteriaceae bacterium]
MNDVRIIEYDPLYKDVFVELNKEWISYYFKLEPLDYELFSNPEKIVNEGGNIFFALYKGKAVGTVALLKKESGKKYEISKMAVAQEHRGKGIGEKLLRHVLEFSEKNKFNHLYLISNTRLTPAIKLYEKLGFKQIPIENNNYERGNYKAEIFL